MMPKGNAKKRKQALLLLLHLQPHLQLHPRPALPQRQLQGPHQSSPPSLLGADSAAVGPSLPVSLPVSPRESLRESPLAPGAVQPPLLG